MKKTVEEVMTSPVHVVTPRAGFKELVLQIQTHAVRALPVVDAEMRLVGIVSEADLLLKENRDELAAAPRAFASGRRRAQRVKAAGVTAADLMTTPVVTVGPAARVADAARLMHKKSIKRLPVVDDDGRVVGIVSRSDVLKVFQREDMDIRREIIEEVIVHTLWLDPMTLKVSCDAGMVQLKGQVDRKSDVRILVRLTERVDGVVDVRENLSYRYDDTKHHQELASPLPPMRW